MMIFVGLLVVLYSIVCELNYASNIFFTSSDMEYFCLHTLQKCLTMPLCMSFLRVSLPVVVGDHGPEHRT